MQKKPAAAVTPATARYHPSIVEQIEPLDHRRRARCRRSLAPPSMANIVKKLCEDFDALRVPRRRGTGE
jgi:hypothetical protein